MKTDDLIARLSVDAKGSRLGTPTLTISAAVAISCLVIVLMSSKWLGLRTDLASALLLGNHNFLLNLVFIISVGSVATTIMRDLSVPGRPLRLPSVAIVVPFVLICGAASRELSTVSLDHFSHHPDGQSFLVCVWQTSMLAVVAFAILAIGIRRLAPTDLRRAGFCLGLLAGAIGSMGHCFHAPNDSLTFGVVVYSAGILVMAVFGGLVGPRLLHWR